MAVNLRQAVVGFLKNRAEQKFNARQIAEWLFETFPEECQEKRANRRGDYIKSDADLVQHYLMG